MGMAVSYRNGFEGDFAAGSVTGLRHWNLDDRDGLLHGAWGIWQPGENIATCAWWGRSKQPREDHLVPYESCGCGFWAYWQNPRSAEVGGKNTVAGIIEGYGPTLIGDLGFRCAKARIVALHCKFKIMRTRDERRGKILWTPEPGMFRRGPQGMEIFNALTGREQQRLEVDEDAMIEVQNILEEFYGAAVYNSMDAMLLRHPTTKDYLPEPRDATRAPS